ncbi:hypothetical protein CK203_008509 [Vitis vinifera]|uniref:Uncharacterized protein n=1 Tax=Vitis vinifera TaxID=29760 RepID=A0A438KP89_VITVI|nr:hypothetical protein CK203_008509 [Vitis vinifera]
MCGGDFMSKNPKEAMDFLSYVAEVSRGWDEPNAREVERMKSQPNAPNAKAGIPITMLHMATPTFQIGGTIEFLLEAKGTSVHATWPSTSIDNLRTQSQGSQPQHSARERKFPSQPHQNPKGIHEVEAQEGESSQVREVKAVITLRSGKEVDMPISNPSMKHEA